MKKRIIGFVLMMILVTTFSTIAFAGSKNPYKDVTRKKVDAQSFTAISYIKRFDGWRGIAKKGKFYPNKTMTRREYLMVLHNLYGNKITVTIADVRGANDKVTSKFVCDRMVALSKVLKYPIKWDGNKTKLKRKDVARYIYTFATFNSAFVPKK